MSFTKSSHSKSISSIKNTDSSLKEEKFDHVMCFGTFDIFHPGHIFYLQEAQRFAKNMTVIIARDIRVQKIKGRYPQDGEDMRLENVSKAFPKAQVILGDPDDIFAPLRNYKPDILAFGYDQRVPEEKIHELFPTLEIRRIDGFETEKWKSSKLRKENARIL